MLSDDGSLTMDLLLDQREHERMFCACVFINPSGALDKCAWLDPSEFTDPKYAEFWKGVKEHGDPMRSASSSNTILDISEASTQLSTSLYPEIYAREIQRHRYFSEASRSIGEIALAISERNECEAQDKVAKLHALSIVDKSNTTQSGTPESISNEFIMRINAQVPSLLTGIDDLDAILGGLFMGELTIMAGRPGIGKTSVATAIAQNIATANKDAKILFFSLEMDKVQLWARMACAKTMYSWKDIRSGRADKFAIEAVAKASEKLRSELEDRLIIIDNTWDVPTIVNICANIRPSLVIVDHLSEIRWKDNADEVKWFGRATKILRTEIARRMHIPVILIHQLNRGVENRDSKRPKLSDLKWSGDLEAIADTVMMLYREDYYEEDNKPRMAVVPMEIWIKKNRQGVTNSCAVVNFDTRTQRFSQARSPSYNSASHNNGSPYPPSKSTLRLAMISKNDDDT